MQQAEEPKRTKITGMLVSLLEAQFYFGADSEITVMAVAQIQFYSELFKLLYLQDTGMEGHFTGRESW